MRKDVRCPYCKEYEEINHDDGYGYEEDNLCQQECGNCEKTFTYYTQIHFSYDVYKADCLNGSEHKYKKTNTIPREFAVYRCKDCEDELPPTEEMIKDRTKYFDSLDKP